eukprot:5581026-Amphidinium_carterae.1
MMERLVAKTSTLVSVASSKAKSFVGGQEFQSERLLKPVPFLSKHTVPSIMSMCRGGYVRNISLDSIAIGTISGHVQQIAAFMITGKVRDTVTACRQPGPEGSTGIDLDIQLLLVRSVAKWLKACSQQAKYALTNALGTRCCRTARRSNKHRLHKFALYSRATSGLGLSTKTVPAAIDTLLRHPSTQTCAVGRGIWSGCSG